MLWNGRDGQFCMSEGVAVLPRLQEDCNHSAIMQSRRNGRTRRPTDGPGSIFPGRLAHLLRWDSMIALGLL